MPSTNNRRGSDTLILRLPRPGKRTFVVITVAIFVAVTLGACSSMFTFSTDKASVTFVNTQDPKAIAALCGPTAHDVANNFSEAANRLPAPGAVKDLTNPKTWNMANTSDETVASVKAALQTRANVDCTSSTSSSSTTPSGTGTPTVTCQAKYVQKFDANKAGRFYSAGVKSSKQDLTYLAHDARTLVFRAFALKLVKSNDPSKYLAPGSKCLSRQGQDLYQQVFGVLSAASVDENGEAPANGYNTGMSGGKAVIDSSAGIGGNRAAIVYTLRSGGKLYVMKRCGNLVFTVKVVGIPVGPTEHERPTSTPHTSSTTPVTSCPRGMHGYRKNGRWICKDDSSAGPAHHSAFPEQQKPNRLPASPSQRQTSKPKPPPSTYTAPKPPTPKPTTPRTYTPTATSTPTGTATYSPPPTTPGCDPANPACG